MYTIGTSKRDPYRVSMKLDDKDVEMEVDRYRGIRNGDKRTDFSTNVEINTKDSTKRCEFAYIYRRGWSNSSSSGMQHSERDLTGHCCCRDDSKFAGEELAREDISELATSIFNNHQEPRG